MWIENGYPYMIHIDDSIPCDRVNPLGARRTITLACPVPCIQPRGDAGGPVTPAAGAAIDT